MTVILILKKLLIDVIHKLIVDMAGNVYHIFCNSTLIIYKIMLIKFGVQCWVIIIGLLIVKFCLL